MRRLVIVLSVMTMLISCSNMKRDDVGQFVYVDYLHVIHIDRECASTLSKNQKTKDERMINMYGIQFIDTCILEHGYGKIHYHEYTFCTKCVDDEVYKHLNAMMDRNKLVTDKRKWLYDKFRRANYSMGAYNEFIKNLGDTEKRKNAYDAASSEGWDVGSFGEFSNRLGFD